MVLILRGPLDETAMARGARELALPVVAKGPARIDRYVANMKLTMRRDSSLFGGYYAATNGDCYFLDLETA